MDARFNQTNHPAVMRSHRGYNCRIIGKNIRCIFVHNWCNYHLPHSFLWANKDWDDLARYIDAVTERRVMDAKRWEDAGTATDLVYEKPTSAAPIAHVNPNALLAILRGELVIEAPLDTVFIFEKRNSRARINTVPMEALTGEVFNEYLRTIQKHIKRPILYCTKGTEFPDGVEMESVQKRAWVNIANAEEALDMPARPDWSDEEDVLDQEPLEGELVVEKTVSGVPMTVHRVTPQHYVLRYWEGEEVTGMWTSLAQDGPWEPVLQHEPSGARQ